MTEKIYYQDAYKTNHEATILQVIEHEKGWNVVTDSTIFYPEGGGQPADRGTINGIEVLDVQEEGNVIYHLLKEKPLNTSAMMEVDWDRRYDFMQQHTGEHILSGLIQKHWGGNNRGFHMGADFVTIDIDIPKLEWDKLMEIEALTNRVIKSNPRIRTDYTDREGLSAHPIRKEVKVDEDIRIITIDDADCCACCGTHVHQPLEIGLLKILKTEQYKGMTRIHFVCGERAYRDYRRRFDIVKETKQLLNADEESIVTRLNALQKEAEEIKYQLREKNKTAARYWAQSLIHAKDKNCLIRSFDKEEYDFLQELMMHIKEHFEHVVLIGEQEGRIIVHSRTQDIATWFKQNLSAYGGKGGGKAGQAQAKFENKADMDAFVQCLKDSLE